MLTANQEPIMVGLILERRKKHLSKLEKESASPSQIRVWEKFYINLLNKYSTSNEVNSYA